MATTDTNTVKVYDMETGALLRVTTTAQEAQRASTLPTAGWILSDYVGATVPTARQIEARKRKSETNAYRAMLAEQARLFAEVMEEVNATRTAELGAYATHDEWQAGYDY